jgi:hypothetical protein
MADTVRVKVRARVDQRLLKYERKAGKYALFKTSRDAYIAARVSPNHAGDCVVFWAEYYVKGHWQYPGKSKCVPLNKDSLTAARLRGHDYLAGIPIRFHVAWGGDDRNAAADSRWAYAKFVRAGASRSTLARGSGRSALRAPAHVAG